MKIPNCSQIVWPGNTGREGWADLYGQTVQGYLAAIWDFHSKWYRDHLVQCIAKSEQLYFGLTGPNLQYCTRSIYVCTIKIRLSIRAKDIKVSNQQINDFFGYSYQFHSLVLSEAHVLGRFAKNNLPKWIPTKIISYFLHWNFDWKSCFVVFFSVERVKNPQFNFLSQNPSI